MNRLVALRPAAWLLGATLALTACDDDEELPEDPPYAVPGQTVTQPPPGQPMPGAMPMGATTFTPELAVPGQPRPLPIAQPQMPPGMQPGQMPPGMQPGQMPPGMQPGQMPPGQVPPGMQPMQPGAPSMPISLAQGFMPDPQTARGMAVGSVPAGSMVPGGACAGHIPPQPSHVLHLTTAFQNLRVLVNGGTVNGALVDTVLVIRKPDGTFLCNDDTVPVEQQNPTIEGPFTPGTYTIWVGTFSQGASGPYVIGFTEYAHVTHAMLGS